MPCQFSVKFSKCLEVGLMVYLLYLHKDKVQVGEELVSEDFD